ncbi:MAG: helix-turn-helix domain-containing protein [Bacteroidetes bacterium]|nr:helix-turn-helix domain-containing protein [Bacteroidota bacterium]
MKQINTNNVGQPVLAVITIGCICFIAILQEKTPGLELNTIKSGILCSDWRIYFYFLPLLGLALYIWKSIKFTNLKRKAITELLKDSEMLKTDIYTNIAHEFRAPLAVIISMAEALDRQSPGTKETIIRNAHNLLNLVNQILDLSKLGGGMMGLRWQKGDVVSYLKSINDNFYYYAEKKQIQLIFYSEIPFLEMDIDIEKLQKIINNLLFNAFKFTPKGGQVVIHIGEISSKSNALDKLLQVKISNTGPGILPEHLHKIFNRFYSVDDDGPHNSEGTGIGLTLTKELLELMGGSISVQSQLGLITVFKVLLPIHNLASEIFVVPNSSTHLHDTGFEAENPKIGAWNDGTLAMNDAPNILIIEDNPDNAMHIRNCLEGQFNVLWAENGPVGIEKALDALPDIIICDVVMPLKDGFEVTQYLKNDIRTSHIPIILITAKAELDFKIRGLETGADAYLSNPFDKKELQIRVKQLISTRKKLKEHYMGNISVDNSQVSSKKPSTETKKNIHIEVDFLEKVNTVIEKHLTDTKFEIPELSRELQLSHSQLFRKIKAVTGKSIAAYIRGYRLQRGRDLLQNSDMNCSEVAYAVGFSDPSYFSHMFLQEYGESPTEYRRELSAK